MSFTAVDQCPQCGNVDLHWLDAPAPKPSREDYERYEVEYQKWLQNPGDRIEAWGGETVRFVGGYPHPRYLIDESMFEVMRVCVNCAHRWGVE